MTDARKALEIFLSCTSIRRNSSRGPINAFAVVLLQSVSDISGQKELHEIGRTETSEATDCPAWTTSIEVGYNPLEAKETSITIEVYHRQEEGVESLGAHYLLGRTRVRVSNLLDAPGMHFLTSLPNPNNGDDKGTILCINSEDSFPSNCDEIIELDFIAASLRRREWPGKPVVQSFQILRAHARNDTDGNIVWLPVYRSCRLGKQNKDNSQYLEFSRVTITKNDFCNGDEERRIRLLLRGRLQESGVKKFNPNSKGIDIELGHVDVTLRDICEVDPTEEVFEIEKTDDQDTSEPGYLSLLKAEPTDVGSHFILQINHADTRRFCSASKKADGLRLRRMTQKFSDRVRRKSVGVMPVPELTMNGGGLTGSSPVPGTLKGEEENIPKSPFAQSVGRKLSKVSSIALGRMVSEAPDGDMSTLRLSPMSQPILGADLPRPTRISYMCDL